MFVIIEYVGGICTKLPSDSSASNIDQSLFPSLAVFLIDIFNNKTDILNKKENLKKLNYKNTWINVNQKIINVINEN